MPGSGAGIAGSMRVAVLKMVHRWGGEMVSLLADGEPCAAWDASARQPVKSHIKQLVATPSSKMLAVHLSSGHPLFLGPDTEVYLPDSDTWTLVSMLQPGTRLQTLEPKWQTVLGLPVHWRGYRTGPLFVVGTEKLWSRAKENTRVRSNIRRKFQLYTFAVSSGTGFFSNSILVRTQR